MSDRFHKVTVELRQEPVYHDEAPKYTIMVMKNNHGSTLHPPFFSRVFAEKLAHELQAQFDAEQAQREQESEASHRRFEEESRVRRAEQVAAWTNARVRNVGDQWTGKRGPRYDQLGTVLDLDGDRIKVRYDDGKVVSAKRKSFELVTVEFEPEPSDEEIDAFERAEAERKTT